MMTKFKKLNHDFFSLFILLLIAGANIYSAICHGMESDFDSMVFNIIIAGFSVVVFVHLFRNY